MSQWIQDIRFSLRQMRKAPAFTVVVILTLSLGIGAAAAVFSVIDAVLIRPLPYAHQERLVMPVLTARTGETLPSSYLGYLDVRAQLHRGLVVRTGPQHRGIGQPKLGNALLKENRSP